MDENCCIMIQLSLNMIPVVQITIGNFFNQWWWPEQILLDLSFQSRWCRIVDLKHRGLNNIADILQKTNKKRALYYTNAPDGWFVPEVPIMGQSALNQVMTWCQMLYTPCFNWQTTISAIVHYLNHPLCPTPVFRYVFPVGVTRVTAVIDWFHCRK